MIRPTRTEYLVGDHWCRRLGGAPAGHVRLLIPDGVADKFPGETDRDSSGGTQTVVVDSSRVRRRVRILVETSYEDLDCQILAFVDGAARLYTHAAHSAMPGWSGDRLDGWEKWVPVAELGEVRESVEEFDAEGNRIG